MGDHPHASELLDLVLEHRVQARDEKLVLQTRTDKVEGNSDENTMSKHATGVEVACYCHASSIV